MTTRVFKMPIAVASPSVLPKVAVSTEEKQIGALRLAGGLRAWWQADVGFLNASAVEWLDRIGSKRLLAQSLPTGAVSIPTKQEASINGKAAIAFSNTSMIDPDSQSFFPFGVDFSFAVVCNIVPTDNAVIISNRAAFGTATYLLRASAERFSFAMNGASVAGADGSAPSAQTHVLVCGYTFSTKTLTLRQNGELVQSTARPQHINQNSGMTIGAHVTADGATATAPIDGGGRIPLIMAFNGDITAAGRAADLALVENWLIAQYR